MIARVRGTEDILDLKLHNFIIDKIRKHLQRYNFSEIQTPILEKTELFVRSLGQETDVVTKEMYTFETEGGDKICLRPEATAGTVRAFLENKIEQTPWKVWSYGSMFRHERPQKGRWRQFSQINMEVINSSSVSEDCLFLKMLDRFFSKDLSLENYVLKINFLGCLDDREKHKSELKKYVDVQKDKICETCLVRKEKNILRIFDCKNESCQKIYKDAPKITDYLCSESESEWNQIQECLDLLSVNYIHDFSLVRGLDYYNGIVFEFSSRDLGAQNAFCGGGRYELAKALGSKKEYPSIGCAIGLGRLMLLLETVIEKLDIPNEKKLVAIIPMAKEQNLLSLLIADKLQFNELSIDVLLDDASIKSKMRRANKIGASHVLIIGEEEQKNNTVSIKDMKTGESQSVKQGDIVKYFK